MIARSDPQNYLCIVHDKMDQAKTHIPRMKVTPKSMVGVGAPLPVSLTGMLTHGRDPSVFAHFGIGGFWPGDSDFTATSLAKCIRDLENFNGDRSGDMYEGARPEERRPFFNALLDLDAFQGGYLDPKKISPNFFRGLVDSVPNSVDSSSVFQDVGAGTQDDPPMGRQARDPSLRHQAVVPPPGRQAGDPRVRRQTVVPPSGRQAVDPPTGHQAVNHPAGRQAVDPPAQVASRQFRPLPRHLLLQMDNSGKDNKNQTILAFCSELVSRGVFETVTMNFLMVGHTHEDIDALFSKVALQILDKEVVTFPQLMAETWLSGSNRPLPLLIQEGADCKEYL